jgi:hypothetical protein
MASALAPFWINLQHYCKSLAGGGGRTCNLFLQSTNLPDTSVVITTGCRLNGPGSIPQIQEIYILHSVHITQSLIQWILRALPLR